jgi:hypothetical protein
MTMRTRPLVVVGFGRRGAVVELPAGTSITTLANGHPDFPAGTQPGTVDLDYVDVELTH